MYKTAFVAAVVVGLALAEGAKFAIGALWGAATAKK